MKCIRGIDRLRPSTLSIPTRLGLVSYFNDCASEVLARALPLFLTTSLGMTPTFVGMIEGAAESISILIRGFSGWISDRMDSRKPLVVFGYSLSVISRILFLFIHLPLLFGIARILERMGKGLRSAPRDAMIADAAAAGLTGHAFGITRFLDTLGAVTGIIVVLSLGIGTGSVNLDVFRKCLWIAIPFGIISLFTLIVFVPKIHRITKSKNNLTWKIPSEIRGYLLAVGIFSLGNSSDAFLVLRANELGYSFRQILILMLAFNLLAAFMAIPIGRLTDRIGRMRILILGWIVYAAVYFSIGFFESSNIFAIACMIYGSFYGFTEGTEKALLADLLAPHERGAGYGALQFVLGLAALPASLITGWLMSTFGSAVAFSVAAGFALIGTALLMLWGLGFSGNPKLQTEQHRK